ncbi:hypothetical protein Lal_00005218 [Lupinus albus]|nr:hypothetical protein Lal_00005218 [Lupinus albus]
MRYADEGVPLVVVAGKEYGTGSSRDWAAKGTRLLGIRAVIAESFERIHRSNLVGMGILPLQFKDGVTRADLKLDGSERFDIDGIEQDLRPRKDVTLTLTRADGRTETYPLLLRIDTLDEVEAASRWGAALFAVGATEAGVLRRSGARHHAAEVVGEDRLVQDAEAATLGLLLAFGAGVAGQDDAGNRLAQHGLDGADRLRTGAALLELVVGQHDLRAAAVGAQPFQRLIARLGGQHVIAPAFQNRLEAEQDDRLVVDHQHHALALTSPGPDTGCDRSRRGNRPGRPTRTPPATEGVGDGADRLSPVVGRSGIVGHGSPCERRGGGGGAAGRTRVAQDDPWQLDREDRALALPRAHRHRMAEQPRQPLDDGQTQAEAAFAALAQLGEFLEDVLQPVGGDASAGVPHLHPHAGRRPAAAQQHLAPDGVAQRVLHEVAQDALQMGRVGADPGAGRHGAQHQPLLGGARAVFGDQPAEHLVQPHLHRGGDDLAGFQPRHVQQPVQQALQRVQPLADVVEDRQSRMALQPVAQRRGEEIERLHRLAQVVAGGGEELGLAVVGLVGLFPRTTQLGLGLLAVGDLDGGAGDALHTAGRIVQRIDGQVEETVLALAADADLFARADAAFHHPALQRHHAVGILALAAQVGIGAADQPVGRKAEPFRMRPGVAQVAVLVEHHHAGVAQAGAHALLGDAQRLLGALALGDVDAGGDQMGDMPVGVDHRGQVDVHRHLPRRGVPPSGDAQPGVEARGPPTGPQRQRLPQPFPSGLVEGQPADLVEGTADDPGGRQPGGIGGGAVDLGHRPVRRQHADIGRQRVQHGADVAFGLAQRRFARFQPFRHHVEGVAELADLRGTVGQLDPGGGLAFAPVAGSGNQRIDRTADEQGAADPGGGCGDQEARQRHQKPVAGGAVNRAHGGAAVDADADEQVADAGRRRGKGEDARHAVQPGQHGHAGFPFRQKPQIAVRQPFAGAALGARQLHQDGAGPVGHGQGGVVRHRTGGEDGGQARHVERQRDHAGPPAVDVRIGGRDRQFAAVGAGMGDRPFADGEAALRHRPAEVRLDAQRGPDARRIGAAQDAPLGIGDRQGAVVGGPGGEPFQVGLAVVCLAPAEETGLGHRGDHQAGAVDETEMLAFDLPEKPFGLKRHLALALRPLFEHAVDLDADRRQDSQQDQDEEACQKGHGVDEAPPRSRLDGARDAPPCGMPIANAFMVKRRLI